MAKIGEGHFQGMARMGMKELAQILPAFPTSVRTVEEPGVVGNPTQPVVTSQMGQMTAAQAVFAEYGARGRGKGQSRGMEMGG